MQQIPKKSKVHTNTRQDVLQVAFIFCLVAGEGPAAGQGPGPIMIAPRHASLSVLAENRECHSFNVKSPSHSEHESKSSSDSPSSAKGRDRLETNSKSIRRLAWASCGCPSMKSFLD